MAPQADPWRRPRLAACGPSSSRDDSGTDARSLAFSHSRRFLSTSIALRAELPNTRGHPAFIRSGLFWIADPIVCVSFAGSSAAKENAHRPDGRITVQWLKRIAATLLGLGIVLWIALYGYGAGWYVERVSAENNLRFVASA